MPLIRSSSREAVSQNIKTEMAAGKPQKQSVAIALSEARRARRARRARGGKVKGYDTGGATDPVTAVVNALQAGSNQTTSAGSNPGMNATAPTSAAFAAVPPAGVTAPTPTPTQNPAATTPANTGLGTSNPFSQIMPTNGAMQAAPAVTAGLAPQVQNPAATNPVQPAGLALQNNMQPVAGMNPAATNPAATNPAGMGMAFGGAPQMPWFAKQEARGLNMHTGPIMSAVPGRTDRHNMSVPSGSYVIPAESISHLGQSNTIAGMKIANNMFGASGPYGAGIPKMGHGMGIPKPPKPMGIPGDKGGARGEGTGTPVDVVTAGGEFVIAPQVVARIGDGDIKRGHKILDAWIMKLRKDHIRTLKNLKPPAKS
jgi:hypothetical protein